LPQMSAQLSRGIGHLAHSDKQALSVHLWRLGNAHQL
jgi:hypothetical protein